MAWFWLLSAAACEIIWAIGLKYTNGLTLASLRERPVILGFTITVMILSFVLLSLAMKTLPLGTSYAIWTGIGAVGVAIYGMARLGEPRDLPRIICIGLIVMGIVGLKALAPSAE